jgi:hypothetical protein
MLRFIGTVIELHQRNDGCFHGVVEMVPEVAVNSFVPLQAVNQDVRIEKIHLKSILKIT